MNVFTEIRLLLKLRPILERMGTLMTMKLTTNVVLQLFAGVAQALNVVQNALPAEGKFWVATGLAVIQVAISVISHLSTPSRQPVPPSN